MSPEETKREPTVPVEIEGIPSSMFNAIDRVGRGAEEGQLQIREWSLF